MLARRGPDMNSMHQPLSLNELQALLTRVFSPDALGEWALLLGCLALAALVSWALFRAVTRRDNSLLFGDGVIDGALFPLLALGLAFGAALLMIYVLLVAQTGSLGMPLIIMVAIPLTVIGIMPGFWLLNVFFTEPVAGIDNPILFTATAMIGMIALAGIVVRNSIILIDFIQRLREQGRALNDALIEAGFELTDDPEKIEVVIASYDREFTWKKFQIAFEALWFHKRAILVATNPDMFCPMPGGRGEVDAGAVIAALEACTGVNCSANVGKPNKLMIDMVMAKTGLDPKKCIMVGDRLYTDIAMGKAAGMDTALVFTGETTKEMLQVADRQSQPTYALERIDELL